MHAPSPDLIDRLAAEYVLGTLRGPARVRFDRWLETPSLAWHAETVGAVRRWDARFTTMLAAAPLVTPGPDVWPAIARRLGLSLAGVPSQVEVRWRPWAIAASLLVVAFGAWWFVGAPERQAWQVAAVLRDAGRPEPLWRVEFDRGRWRLRVAAVAPYALAPGRAHELWALRDGKPPVTLGLLPQGGVIERSLGAAQQAALLQATNLAVSLEPAGGSPTGAPTGPVQVVMPLPRGS